MPSIKWLVDLGATNVDVILLIMGIAFFLFYVFNRKADQKEKDVMWEKINTCNDRYHRLDALQFGTSKAIQAANGDLKLVNESANGDGDYTIDRS